MFARSVSSPTPRLRFVKWFLAIAFVTVFVLLPYSHCTNLTVLSWNVESGGSDDQTIKQRIASFQGVDLWGLSEVASLTSAGIFETGAEDGEEATFDRIVGTTGGADRLAIIFNSERFQLVRHRNLQISDPEISEPH
jgi:hypothetical protein